jgi:hypothetical protein
MMTMKNDLENLLAITNLPPGEDPENEHYDKLKHVDSLIDSVIQGLKLFYFEFGYPYPFNMSIYGTLIQPSLLSDASAAVFDLLKPFRSKLGISSRMHFLW